MSTGVPSVPAYGLGAGDTNKQNTELLSCARKNQSTTLPGPMAHPWVLAPCARDQGGGGCEASDASLGWWAGVVAPGKSFKEITSAYLKGAERELTSPGREEPAHAKAWPGEMALCAQDASQAAVGDGAGQSLGGSAGALNTTPRNRVGTLEASTRRPK